MLTRSIRACRGLAATRALASYRVDTGVGARRALSEHSTLIDDAGGIVAEYDKNPPVRRDAGGAGADRGIETHSPRHAPRLVRRHPWGAVRAQHLPYDLRFAYFYRAYAQRGGADVHPAAFYRAHRPRPLGGVAAARAIETGAFVLAAAQGGLHADGRTTYGHALAVGPWGEVMANPGEAAPALRVIDLDLAQWRGRGHRSGLGDPAPDRLDPVYAYDEGGCLRATRMIAKAAAPLEHGAQGNARMTSSGDGRERDRSLDGPARDLAAWFEQADGDQGWLAALPLWRGGRAGGGRRDGPAETAFRRVLDRAPHDLWSWVGLIDVLRARGRHRGPPSRGARKALRLLPDQGLLRRKTAEALEAAGDPAAALDLSAGCAA